MLYVAAAVVRVRQGLSAEQICDLSSVVQSCQVSNTGHFGLHSSLVHITQIKQSLDERGEGIPNGDKRGRRKG